MRIEKGKAPQRAEQTENKQGAHTPDVQQLVHDRQVVTRPDDLAAGA